MKSASLVVQSRNGRGHGNSTDRELCSFVLVFLGVDCTYVLHWTIMDFCLRSPTYLGTRIFSHDEDPSRLGLFIHRGIPSSPP